MNRRVIKTIEGSRCTPFEVNGAAGFLCTRGPRPVIDILECGHTKTSHNGKRPTRKCNLCNSETKRRAVISKDGERLVVLEELPDRWRVTVTTAVIDDDPGTDSDFGDEAEARAAANAAWADPVPA